MNRYAIIENQTVVNVATADSDFAASQNWILIPDDYGIGDLYVNGLFAKKIPDPEITKKNNKEYAVALLAETDWAATVEISNPEYSTPYLVNQSEFLTYRSQIRAIAINPPETPFYGWPTKPDAIWSN